MSLMWLCGGASEPNIKVIGMTSCWENYDLSALSCATDLIMHYSQEDECIAGCHC